MKKRRPRPNPGRKAIEWIKEQFDNGRKFDSPAELRDAIAHRFGYLPGFIDQGKVRDWARQAQLERADALKASTSATPTNRYLRDPNAPGWKRLASRFVSFRVIQSLITNALRIARADASQIDVLPEELSVVAKLEMLKAIADTLPSSSQPKP